MKKYINLYLGMHLQQSSYHVQNYADSNLFIS